VGQRADRVEADVAPQFQPDFVADAIAHGRLQTGGGELIGKQPDVGGDIA
jgi:hypothetical protein